MMMMMIILQMMMMMMMIIMKFLSVAHKKPKKNFRSHFISSLSFIAHSCEIARFTRIYPVLYKI